MPPQLADLTLAEVEDFVPAMASILAPIFGAIGVFRYPTKPIAKAVLVHPVSICTYLQGSQPLVYPKVLSAIMTREKASPLPREHNPVNWYAAPLSLDGCPFRFSGLRKPCVKPSKLARVLTPTWIPCISFYASRFPIDIGRIQ